MTHETSTVGSVIAARRAEGRGLLVGYLPVGFPDFDTSVDAMVALAENGCDIIEMGLPYSDPVMDGPAIQRAAQTALDAGFRTSDVFRAIQAVRARVDVPILVMTYWNPVMQYGVDRFADDLAAAGGAGLITPDITPDSAADWVAASDRVGLDRVFLAAPSSTDERLAMTVEASRGFVYATSTMGITGARSELDEAARRLVARLRGAGVDSVCVGIGISTRAQVTEVHSFADGAIVGAALVTALADGGVGGVAAKAAELSGRAPH